MCDDQPDDEIPSAMTNPSESNDHESPKWVRHLSAALKRVGSQPGKQGATPREAAVLVLLIDEPSGVQVLLTERASGLRSYPGQITFPGGKKDPDDADPTATALREAQEEVGLDPVSVHSLGSLPTTVDPGGKTTVTPVLAWSACPSFPGAVSSKEVADVHRVAIRHLPASLASRLGTMTAEIIDDVVTLLDVPTAKDPSTIHPDLNGKDNRRGRSD